MTFSENLRKYRIQHGMTQIDLSERCGINPKTLSSYETGRTEPNLGEIRKICSVFNCSIAEITGTKEREIGNVTYEDIVVKISDLSDDELLSLSSKIEKIAKNRREIKEMLKEKELLEKRLSEYRKRLSNLMEGSNDGHGEKD